jgi:galactokinase
MERRMNPTLAAPATQPSALRSQFFNLYGSEGVVFRAPGRVNLIGEHTDYNDGFVLPAAIGLYTWVVAGPRPDRVLRVYSTHFDESIDLQLDELGGPPTKHWSDYVRGVAAVLQSLYALKGANLVINSEVPVGAGLSSSAAIEVSTALALIFQAGIDVPRLELPRICQRAENEYSGAMCGIMDQFISCFGEKNHALMLDCRSLQYQMAPIPDNARLVICNTMVRHELSGGEYNERRAACETASRKIASDKPSVRALRDVTMADLNACREELGEVVYRRCRHVVTENQRVLDAVDALKRGDLSRFGELMYASHTSLRDDYEVSCDELNIMVDIASRIQGVYGARMTGGGFGGCTINLVAREAASEFKAQIAREYEKATGLTPSIYICSAADGARSVQ